MLQPTKITRLHEMRICDYVIMWEFPNKWSIWMYLGVGPTLGADRYRVESPNGSGPWREVKREFFEADLKYVERHSNAPAD